MIDKSYSLCTSTSGAIIRYSLDIFVCAPNDCLKYVDVEKFSALCKIGCPNYDRKWSCPPFAPTFTDFVSGWNKLFILFLRTEMSQFAYIKNDYLKIKAANSILKSRADKFLRYLAATYGRYISTGSCRLCKPCKRKMGLLCAHWELMTYSFEAMGVDVSKLVCELFQKPLLWYKPCCLPEYTSVVCGLLTNVEIMADDLRKEYLRYIVY